MKKRDLPAMPFYWGDWFKALDVQMLPRDVRCTWFEMLGRMWEGKYRGELSVNGHAPTIEELAMLLGFGSDVKECQRHLDFLERFSVFSRKKSGVIFCRKMVKQEEISITRAISGAKGMASRYNKPYNKVITNPEDENESERLLKHNTPKPKMSDEEWLVEMKANKAYTGIDIEKELAKMDAWLSFNPKRQKTKRFIVNWLNKIDKPVSLGGGGAKNAKKQRCMYCNVEIDAGVICKSCSNIRNTTNESITKNKK